MGIIQVFFESFQFMVGLAKPMVVDFHRICIPEFMERDWITIAYQIRSVVFWACLMKQRTVIERTTCFHEISKNESTRFFTNISLLKKKTNSLSGQKRAIYQSFEYLRKSKQMLQNHRFVCIRKICENMS